ncbi:MAG TPA: hypothetical protein VMT70_24410 [Vicinamibacteria bacterium]|nr:hypothetical protein [Vicinamibacteria bacterium]
MRLSVLAVALGLGMPALAQVPSAGLSVRKEKVSGAEAEFVNYPWRPDVFQAMESGGAASDAPRSWAFARLATSSYFAIDGKVIPSGHYVLALTPHTGSLPMTLELRRGEGRELFVDPTAMAPPSGEIVYKSPAAFVPAGDLVPSLDVTLTRWSDGVALTIRYGNRKLTKDLVQVMP